MFVRRKKQRYKIELVYLESTAPCTRGSRLPTVIHCTTPYVPSTHLDMPSSLLDLRIEPGIYKSIKVLYLKNTLQKPFNVDKYLMCAKMKSPTHKTFSLRVDQFCTLFKLTLFPCSFGPSRSSRLPSADAIFMIPDPKLGVPYFLSKGSSNISEKYKLKKNLARCDHSEYYLQFLHNIICINSHFGISDFVFFPYIRQHIFISRYYANYQLIQ